MAFIKHGRHVINVANIHTVKVDGEAAIVETTESTITVKEGAAFLAALSKVNRIVDSADGEEYADAVTDMEMAREMFKRVTAVLYNVDVYPDQQKQVDALVKDIQELFLK